jgi:RNA polymerase sigma-70 factor, ECF subfamily
VTLTPELPADTELFDDARIGCVITLAESEKDLVAGLRSGENSSYEVLIRSLGPQVLAIARRYLKSEADATDCFQDTFVAVFNSIGSYAGQSSIRQWVRGVTINQCLMALRKRKRAREESFEHMMPLFDETGARVQPVNRFQHSGIETAVAAESLQQTVRRGIDQLPDDYRIVLLLRDIDGHNTRETAAILGIRINAVKTRLHRARTALRFILEPILEQTDFDADV